MQFEDLLHTRRSIRKFESRPVDPEAVAAILAAVEVCPTAGGLQPYEIVSVTDEEKRKELCAICFNQPYVAEAPHSLVFFADPGPSREKYGDLGADFLCIQDATVATTFAHLRAADLGVGAVWIGAFDDDKLRALVGAPEHLKPVAVLSMGYPAETPEPIERRPVSSFYHGEDF